MNLLTRGGHCIKTVKWQSPEKVMRSYVTERRVVQITAILCKCLENLTGAGTESGRRNRERNASVSGVLGKCLSVELSFLLHCSLRQSVKWCNDVVKCSYSKQWWLSEVSHDWRVEIPPPWTWRVTRWSARRTPNDASRKMSVCLLLT